MPSDRARTPAVARTSAAPVAARPPAERPPAQAREVQTLQAFAALAVVMAVRYQPVFLFFPARAFFVGLFCFAAGQAALLPVGAGPGGALSRLRAEARSWLGLLYGASLAAALLAAVLGRAGVPVGGAVPSFAAGAAALESVKVFLFSTFGFGEGYALLPAGWLLAQGFLASALFLALGLLRSRLALTLGVALCAAVSLVAVDDVAAGPLRLLLGRTGYGLGFYLLGHLLATASERTRALLLSPGAMVASSAAADALGALFGAPLDPLEPALLATGGLAPLLRAAALVLLVWQVAHHAARIAGERSALLPLGRAARVVVAAQSILYFACTALFALAGQVDRAHLTAAFMFEPNRTWLLYLGAALLLPSLAVRALSRKAAAQ
jgi:hypothetical protein